MRIGGWCCRAGASSREVPEPFAWADVLDTPPVFTSTLMLMDRIWTTTELRTSLGEFERDLREAGLSKNTVHTYIDRAERFVRYLTGEYHPGR